MLSFWYEVNMLILRMLIWFVIGILFVHENLKRLTEEDEDSMLIGFEITFPALLEIAKNLGLNLPFDEPDLQMIYAKRELKLSKYKYLF